MPYIDDRMGGARRFRSVRSSPSNSPLTLMGVGGCGMGEDWTLYGQSPPAAVTNAATSGQAGPAVSAAEPSFWDRFGDVLKGITATPTAATAAPVYVAPVQSGMSTTTMIALAGGAILLVALIARK